MIPVPLGTVARRVVELEDGTTTTEPVGEVTSDGERLVPLIDALGDWWDATAGGADAVAAVAAAGDG